MTLIQLTLELTLSHCPGGFFRYLFPLLSSNWSKLILGSLIKLLLISLLLNLIEIFLTFPPSHFLMLSSQLLFLTLTVFNLLMKYLQLLNVSPDTNLSTLNPFLTNFFDSLFTLKSSHWKLRICWPPWCKKADFYSCSFWTRAFRKAEERKQPCLLSSFLGIITLF